MTYPLWVWIFPAHLNKGWLQGQLPDGTVIAVKQLSSKSKQGNREFLNEIGMISCLQHPNLVKLHGCCIEGEQLLLVYEYMENNNLARAIFGEYYVILLSTEILWKIMRHNFFMIWILLYVARIWVKWAYLASRSLLFWLGSSIGFDFESSGYWFFLICNLCSVPFLWLQWISLLIQKKIRTRRRFELDLLYFLLVVGQEINQLKLNWPTRLKICIGIARGLAFLHEESRIKIVHRDIKATNVLLDGDLNPKISDFGLARLDEEEKTHISTRVAGTMSVLILLTNF